MSDPDLDKLAVRWLDLWQNQLQAVAGDRAMAEQVARLMAAANAQAAAAFAAVGAMTPKAGAPNAGAAASAGAHSPQQGTAGDGDAGSRAQAAGTAPAAAASGDGASDLRRIAQRLDDIDRRLSVLETDLVRRKRRRKPLDAGDVRPAG